MHACITIQYALHYLFKLYRHNFIEYNFSFCGPGNQPSNLEVDKLLEEVEKYTLASHLLWGLWGVISVLFLPYLYTTYVSQSIVNTPAFFYFVSF